MDIGSAEFNCKATPVAVPRGALDWWSHWCLQLCPMSSWYNLMFQSGAAAWTTAQRQAFANDLTNPQLIAVTDNVNQAKSDAGPEAWKPPLSKFYQMWYLWHESWRFGSFLLLHLCKNVGQGQIGVLFDGHKCREERFGDHARILLIRRVSWTKR